MYFPTTFSVSVWFNTSASNDNPNNNRIIGNRGTTSKNQRGFHITTGTKQSFIVANGNDNAEIIIANNYNDNNWHNLVATYDQTTGIMNLYIDGVLKKTVVKAITGSIQGEYPLVAGGLYLYPYLKGTKLADNHGKMIDISNQIVLYHAFSGSIDDLRVYNRVITSEEVENMYTYCKTDEECDDQNKFTIDKCKNPNAPQSKCIYEPIVCQKTDVQKGIGYPDISKCGSKEAIGEEYCSKIDGINSVVKKYRVPTCITSDLNKIRKAYPDYVIPQNTHFFCSYTLKEEGKKCPYNKCADGKCVNPLGDGIKCHYDIQCNDKNPNTQDTCVNKGTTESYCSNEVVQIACKNTLFGNTCNGGKAKWSAPYCVSNIIYKNYTWFTCNNPGKSTSYCTNQSKKVIIKRCDVLKGYRCIDGACIKTKV